MNREFEQKAIEHAMQLRSGMPADDAARLAAFNEEQHDWFAFCPKCGSRLEGSLKELRGHSCA